MYAIIVTTYAEIAITLTCANCVFSIIVLLTFGKFRDTISKMDVSILDISVFNTAMQAPNPARKI